MNSLTFTGAEKSTSWCKSIRLTQSFKTGNECTNFLQVLRRNLMKTPGDCLFCCKSGFSVDGLHWNDSKFSYAVIFIQITE